MAVIVANRALLSDVAAWLNGFHAELLIVIAIAVVEVVIVLFDK
jgi:hypothetical protein